MGTQDVCYLHHVGMIESWMPWCEHTACLWVQSGNINWDFCLFIAIWIWHVSDQIERLKKKCIACTQLPIVQICLCLCINVQHDVMDTGLRTPCGQMKCVCWYTVHKDWAAWCLCGEKRVCHVLQMLCRPLVHSVRAPPVLNFYDSLYWDCEITEVTLCYPASSGDFSSYTYFFFCFPTNDYFIYEVIFNSSTCFTYSTDVIVSDKNTMCIFG